MINCFIAQIIDMRLNGKRTDLERRIIGVKFLGIDVCSDAKLGRRCFEQFRILTFALGLLDIPGDRILQTSLAIHRGKVHRAINYRVA